MALYQRWLASSAYAMRHSLENRARRLTENIKRAQEIVLTAPRDLPTEEDLEEMEEAERERLEGVLATITLAQNPAQVRDEVARRRDFRSSPSMPHGCDGTTSGSTAPHRGRRSRFRGDSTKSAIREP